MTVYADVLISVNFIIDYFLIGFTAKILKSPCRFSRQIVGGIVGGLCSLIILLPQMSRFLELLLLFLTSVIIIFASFGLAKIKVFIKRVICFYISTFMFSGGLGIVAKILKPPKLLVRNGVVYYGLSAVLLVVFAIISYISITLIHRFLKRNNPQTLNVFIKHNEVSINVMALVDSGNRLREPFSEKWVMLLDSSYEGLFSNITVPKRVIPYNTVSGAGVLYGFCPEQIKLQETNENLDMYVAFSPKPLESGYGAILSSEAI